MRTRDASGFDPRRSHVVDPGHSLKIRIGGRSPARRLVAGLLFTASRTEPASYAYLKNVFASETGHVILFAGRAHADPDVLAESGQELHQSLDGEDAGTVPHQRGNVRLLDAEDFPGLRLG